MSALSLKAVSQKGEYVRRTRLLIRIVATDCLVIPKCEPCARTCHLPLLTSFAIITDHCRTITDLPDEQMKDILPFAKRLAKATVRISEISYECRTLHPPDHFIPFRYCKGSGALQHSPEQRPMGASGGRPRSLPHHPETRQG